jgi:sigma-B regulation protein RsbU (phosphoserine phosphatase)
MTETIVDGRPAFIFYRPVQRTGRSIAIVCPASDIFVRYNQLLTIVWIVIGVSLLALMAFCLVAVRHAMLPLRQLDQQARRIAEGHFDEPLPQSRRRDSIGRLTNSFILMQQSLATMVTDLRQVNEQLEQHNDELSEAYRIQLDTNRRREQFIHDMYHEIRTPLNIISGFAQVLSSSQHALQPDEVADITSRMQQSAGDISRLAHQLEQA